jgi:Tol biopolymer transport system component
MCEGLEDRRLLSVGSPNTELSAVLSALAAATSSSSEGRIAFVSDRDGNNEIYVANTDGSAQTRLTSNTSGDYSPALSPDGKKIVFGSDRDGTYAIYMMNVDGSGQTRISTGTVDCYTPVFSPDGSKIAFSSGPGVFQAIYVMNTDGTGQVALTSNLGNSHPSFSPDGSKIVFFRGYGGLGPGVTSQIYVMNNDGSSQTALTNGVAEDWVPSFSPDGSKIVFCSDRDGNAEIYVMNADGTGQTRLTNSTSNEYRPSFSPDGTKIVFDSGGEIYVMNADGTAQTRLTVNSAWDSEPFWGPPSALPPTISGVVVSTAKGVITWNVYDADGIAGVSLKLDNVGVSKIYGPYAAAKGLDYSGKFGTLSAGSHTYLISATDTVGNTSTATGTFTVVNPGPTISSIIVAEAASNPVKNGILETTDKLVITWAAGSANGAIAGQSVTVDGKAIKPIYGPYSNVNYSCPIGTWAAGTHDYVIATTDSTGASSTASGTFMVIGTTTVTPEISHVIVAEAASNPSRNGVLEATDKLVITWSASSTGGSIALQDVKVDGTTVTPIYGPYGGVNYACPIGMRTAGSHAYAITTTDSTGASASASGTFTVVGATNAGPTIGNIVVATEKGVITWNVFDADGVAGCSLAVDGVAVSKVFGPYTAATGANYAGKYGTLPDASHTYTITATDKLGNISTMSGAFTTGDSATATATSAVFGSVASKLATSAKVDWLCDLDGV